MTQRRFPVTWQMPNVCSLHAGLHYDSAYDYFNNHQCEYGSLSFHRIFSFQVEAARKEELLFSVILSL